MSEIKRKSEITITVGLDEQNIPSEIIWNAEDSGGGLQPCKAMLLSLFDEESLDTVKLDLWTKYMQIDEMDRFMYQTLRGLADSYYKATQNSELANQFQSFIQHFGESCGLIPPTE